MDAHGRPEDVGGLGVPEVVGERAFAHQSEEAAQQDARGHQPRGALFPRSSHLAC